jgi:hypothetical protein
VQALQRRLGDSVALVDKAIASVRRLIARVGDAS